MLRVAHRRRRRLSYRVVGTSTPVFVRYVSALLSCVDPLGRAEAALSIYYIQTVYIYVHGTRSLRGTSINPGHTQSFNFYHNICVRKRARAIALYI